MIRREIIQREAIHDVNIKADNPKGDNPERLKFFREIATIFVLITNGNKSILFEYIN